MPLSRRSFLKLLGKAAVVGAVGAAAPGAVAKAAMAAKPVGELDLKPGGINYHMVPRQWVDFWATDIVFEDPDPKKMKKLITRTKRNAARAVRRKRREHGFPPIRNFGWVIQKREDMYDAVQVTHQFQMFI